MPARKGQESLSLEEIRNLLGAKVIGDKTIVVKSISALDQAEPSSLSLLTDAKYGDIPQLVKQGPVAALLTKEKIFAKLSPEAQSCTSYLLVEDPQRAMFQLIPYFFTPHPRPNTISPMADIHPTARIGKNVTIQSFCTVGAQATIEDQVMLHPQVTVYPGVTIGARSVIHSGAVIREDCAIGPDSVVQNGAVIGADGFGYMPDPNLGLVAFPQVGAVTTGSRVDIGANSCVDRGALGNTSVGDGTKIDNLVQIGHNTLIGKHTIVCGLTGISGSCKIGNQVVMGGGVGVADHCEIADGVRLGARSGVSSDIKEKGDYAGTPAVSGMQWKRQCKVLEQLPSMMKEIRAFLKQKRADNQE